MCGVIMLAGPHAVARLPECLSRLNHRGPDDQNTWTRGDLALGFNRLIINGDHEVGRQPRQHGDLIGAINGQIYNHRALRAAHDLPDLPDLPDLSKFTDHMVCDTDVVLPLFSHYGARIIDVLDGFYSAVILRPHTREAICLRDHMGKKPLFAGKSGSEVVITSELKALDTYERFEVVPRGVAKVNLDTGEVTQIAEHQAPHRRAPHHRASHHRASCHLDSLDAPPETLRGLPSALEEAVRKRMPDPQRPVGLFLSGGLDSSLIAALASRIRDDITYFTLGDEDGPDRRAVNAVIDALGLADVRSIPLPQPDLLPALIRDVVYATESFNPSIISNGLATFTLARAARDAGIKVVLTGEGADELFGGYHTFSAQDPWREVRRQLIDDMQLTELRRLDLSCMANSVEPRCPFLDRSVRAISDQLRFNDIYDGGENKITLRRSFRGALPPELLHRRKTSFDVGSGVRGLVVRELKRGGMSEREALRLIWSERFAHESAHPYFHAYPVFDEVIDHRGEGHR